MSVQGVKAITVAIGNHKRATAKGVQVGLLRAGLFLKRESQMIVPVDKSFLKNSADLITRLEGTGFESEMTVGYGQDYAVFVHENMEARHKPGTSAKFLEKPIRQKSGRMAEIVQDAILEFAE